MPSDAHPDRPPQIHLAFWQPGFGATVGCNFLTSSRWTLVAGVLTVPDLGSTAIGCSAPATAQDEWLAGLLRSAPTLWIDGPAVVLVSGDVEIRLVDGPWTTD